VLAAPVVIDGRELFVTSSVGVASTDVADTSAETLLENADAAMYRAKERGGGRCEVYQEAIRSASRSRLATHSELHRGVERGEFAVLYQPMVSLVSGDVVGAEALVRWRHPERGVVAPADFISAAEETGLIVPIGALVLWEACRQVSAWRSAGRSDLTVSVNLSPRQFADPGLTELVAGALDDLDVDPAGITLEITESTLMEDVPATTTALKELKSLGVRLAIDDFGTGYSSLRYLSCFPLDGIKVDRSFVQGLGKNDGDTAIVAAVVRLAHTLGLSAIAEGVELHQQLPMLQELGCEVAQGFLFSPPVAASELAVALATAGRSAGTIEGETEPWVSRPQRP
jgi:EAL domain-containing protein (putative c-di-GMP-specific phosphodiesterase class I)